jgi:predicted PhzF superfamily epimerase YddE/YHI9
MAPRNFAPLFLVDAFADHPFTGNPAAVCLLDRWPDDAWLQNVAAEMKQSETAFLVSGDSGYELRWFTPTVEVDLCGHATLASAFALWHAQRVPREEPIHFHTRSGQLSAYMRGELIELDFPIEPQQECPPPPGLLESLNVRAGYVGKSRFDLLLELDSEAAVRAVTPDFRQLAKVACRGVIVTARSSIASVDFVSRFFAPASGIDEDPVTGSAHCTLAHFWRARLNKCQFCAYQCSARGGRVEVQIVDDRVRLAGCASLVAKGHLIS